MKKISESYYCWLVRTNKRVWAKIGGRGRKAPRYRSSGCSNLVQPILLPSILSLDHEDAFEALVQSVSSLRERIPFRNFAPIDFRPIQEISPSGALILAAEIDRLRRKRQMTLRPWYEEDWHPAVKKVFSQFKLFELLKISREAESHDLEHTRFVPLRYGTRAQGEVAIALRESLELIIGEALEKKTGLWQ